MIKCGIKKYNDDDEYPHKIYGLEKEEALFIQNFLNTLGIPDTELLGAVDDLWKKDQSLLWICEEEYQALISNANLLGIEFTVSN